MKLLTKEQRQRVINRDGAKDILLHFMEEVGEMLSKINHLKRGKCKHRDLEKEIADVLVCLEFVKGIFDLSDIAIEKYVNDILFKIKVELGE